MPLLKTLNGLNGDQWDLCTVISLSVSTESETTLSTALYEAKCPCVYVRVRVLELVPQLEAIKEQYPSDAYFRVFATMLSAMSDCVALQPFHACHFPVQHCTMQIDRPTG